MWIHPYNAVTTDLNSMEVQTREDKIFCYFCTEIHILLSLHPIKCYECIISTMLPCLEHLGTPIISIYDVYRTEAFLSAVMPITIATYVQTKNCLHSNYLVITYET